MDGAVTAEVAEVKVACGLGHAVCKGAEAADASVAVAVAFAVG